MTASTSEVMAGLVKALRECDRALTIANTPQYAGKIEAFQAHSLAKLAIRSSLAAYEKHERTQLAKHYLDARGRDFPAQVEDDPPGVVAGRAL